MMNSINNDWLDEIRRRVQEALSQAKKDKLRDQYGVDDIRIAGMMTHFTYSTPEYDRMICWLDLFVPCEGLC